MKKIKAVEILFNRQNDLTQRAVDLREERERVKRRLDRLNENIESVELEAESIKDSLIEDINFSKLKVKLLIAEEFTQIRGKRLMLEIQIEGIKVPLYKLLSYYEVELLEKSRSNSGKLILETRLKKMALDFINVHSVLPDSRSYDLNSSTVIEQYIGHINLQNSIQNARINIINR